MIEKILIFIMFLGPLVFFHELGHFLFARLFGVRVETFSIGFGPKILKVVKGGTEYAISLIPLGGYVKMFGDDPMRSEELSEEERKYAFNYKSKWARFWIVFGGPLANFILAFFIFFSIFMIGEKVPLAQFGSIAEESFLKEKGVQSGDIVKKVNDKAVLGFTDLTLDEKDLVSSITVERGAEVVDIKMGVPFKQFMEEYFKYLPRPRKAILIDTRGNKFVVSQSSEKVLWEDSLEKLAELDREKFYLYALKNPLQAPTSGNEINQQPEVEAKFVKEIITEKGKFFESLRTAGFYPIDLRVENVVKDSPADQARVKTGDILASINGTPLTSFDDLRIFLQKNENQSKLNLGFYRLAELNEVQLAPQMEMVGEEKVWRLGIYSGGEFQSLAFVEGEGRGVVESLTLAFDRTIDSIVKTVVGFKKLVTQEVSFKNIGGPLAIGKVASDSFQISLSYFFKLMAFISVNLGVINLFPIPVLDGGHIFFLLLEFINGGPLSRKKLEIAQQVGVSVLFILIFAALFNDVTRLMYNS